MKRFWLTGLLLLWGVMTWAQQSYSAYYYQRVSLFEMLPVSPGDIVFLGNSITDGCEWNELLGRTDVRNRGISGDTSMGVYIDLYTPMVDPDTQELDIRYTNMACICWGQAIAGGQR